MPGRASSSSLLALLISSLWAALLVLVFVADVAADCELEDPACARAIRGEAIASARIAAIVKAYNLRIFRSSFKTRFRYPWEGYRSRLVTRGWRRRPSCLRRLPWPEWYP